MKLGTLSIGLPVFVIESDVTYQTVRSPTVFERMIMRLCGRHGTVPGVGDLTLLQVFGDRLGVTSAAGLVGPSLENLVHLGVVSSSANDLMLCPLSRVQLTPQGRDFLERDRLPSQAKQASVKHLFLPLLNAVTPYRPDPRLSTTPLDPHVDPAVLQPADCSHLVREVLAGEPHTWKTANTEVGYVESRVASVLWEAHQIVVDCDASGVMSVASVSSPELNRWLANVHPDVLWQNLLEPLLRVDPLARWPNLGSHPLKQATGIGLVKPVATEASVSADAAEGVLHVLGDPALLANYSDEDIVVLSAGIGGLRKLSSKSGTLAIEVPAPSTLPAGFERLTLGPDLVPSLTCAGLVQIIWAGQERQAVLRVTASPGTAAQVWSTVQGVLSDSIRDSADAEILALAATWEPPSETIARWCSGAEKLALGDLLHEAGSFVGALARLAASSEARWGAQWHEALTGRMEKAVARLKGSIPLDTVLGWLEAMDRLVAVRARPLLLPLLSHCASTDDAHALARLRQIVGSKLELPRGLIGDGVIVRWIAGALTDEVAPTFGPHPFAEPIERLRSAHRSVLRGIGLKSLEDARSGTLSLTGVSASALASTLSWQSAVASLTELRPSLSQQWPDRFVLLDPSIAAWLELASSRLSPPAPAGQRLVVLDTNALMDRPDFLLEMRRTDVPVVPQRVLEELDGLKHSADEGTAGKARAAIRALERAGKVVRYETEVLDLLPADWGTSPDNRILSVAMHLRLSDVLVVTADRNLRNKARAAEVPAMLPDEYIRACRGQADGDNSKRGASMSKFVDGTYELERSRRQYLFDQRVREKTRAFLDRYRQLLADIESKCLKEYVESEFKAFQEEIVQISWILESDPAAAREASLGLGKRISAFPRHARAMQETIEAEREAEQRQARAREDLELVWQEELAAWSDPFARRLAFAELGALRVRLMAPDTHTTVDELRTAMGSIRHEQERESRETRLNEEVAAQAEANAQSVQQCRDDIKQGRGLTVERAHQLEAALAEISDSTPVEAFQRLAAISREIDAAAVDESCRREVVQAVYRSLEDAGFVNEKPRLVRVGDGNEVVIVGRRPAGAQATFKVELSGKLNYKFDQYRGSECKKDIDAVLPRLQSVYGIKLSDDRVLWENPVDTDSEARPQPGMTREK